MADKFCAVSFLQISAPEMDDRMLTELLDTDNGLLVSLHIRSMDQNEAIKTVKRKITDIDSMKIDAQKKAVRGRFRYGYHPHRSCHLRRRGKEHPP